MQKTAVAQAVVTKNFSFFSQRDGLSNYNVHKILQDNKNFIWVATQDGLNRFDGREFIVFNKGLERRRELFSNDIRDLVFDSIQNILWVICNQGGVNGIDIVTNEVKYAHAYTNKFLETSWRTCACFVNTKIYIGTSGGLEIFNTCLKRFEVSKLASQPYPTGLQGADIRTLTVDPQKNIWAGILHQGLVVYNPDEDALLQRISAERLRVKNEFWPQCSSFSEDGRYWLGTKKGLFGIRADQHYKLFLNVPPKNAMAIFSNREINSLLINENAELVTAGNGLLTYNFLQNRVTQIQPVENENEKWFSDITYCFEDRENNLWLGCKQGLGQIKSHKSAFQPIRNNEALNNELGHVYSIHVLDSSNLLVGTKKGMFLIQNGNKIRPLLESGLVQNIFSLVKKEVIVSGNDGIRLFHDFTIRPIERVYKEFLPYKAMQLNSSVRWNDSLVVLGTESNDGVLLWNESKRTIENLRYTPVTNRGLVSNNVNRVFLDRANRVIVLSDYGLTVLSGTKNESEKIVLKDNRQHPLGIFMDMTETPSNYWITAYGEGLVKMDKTFHVLKTYGRNEGLSNTGLYKIFNYRDSLLILTSNYGISVFNLQNETFKKFYVTDGLQNDTFEEACGDSLNNVFFAGGVEGYVKISPTLIKPAKKPPELYFTELEIKKSDGKTTDTSNLFSSTFSVPSSAAQITVSFVGLYYENPSRVSYQYQIKEINDGWIDLNSQNFVSLVGIGPGTYTLKVRAANEDGIWSEIKELKLIFLPKWYQTLWFKLALLITFFSFLYAAYRYRISQIKAKSRIRKEIASDLHDDIGSTLNSVSVFTHLAKQNGRDPFYLSKIEEALTEATAGLRDIIWVLDDTQDTVNELMERIKRFAFPVTIANGIAFKYELQIDDKDQKLTKKEKRNLLLLAKEIINNSVKYACCKNIYLYIKRNSECKRLIIEDDGRGFDPRVVREGNGLKNIKYRASQIGYEAEIVSCRGQGTTIRVVKKI